MRRETLLALTALIAACATNDAPKSAGNAAGATTTAPAQEKAEADLKAILDAHWALVLEENPTFATSLGVRAYDAALPDPSLEAYEEGIAAREALLDRLRRLGTRGLGDADELNRDLLLRQLESEIEAARHDGKYVIISNRYGPHLFLAGLPERLPFRTAADYRSYVARLGEVPGYLDAAEARLREGVARGWVQPCESMEGYEDTINIHAAAEPEASVFMTPFEERPTAVSEREFALLQSAARMAVARDVLPAFRDFETFYNLEYQPACRSEAGLSSLEGGLDYYKYLARDYTTTTLTVDEIHEKGLDEVARIRAEMEAIAAAEGYESLAAFQAFLRADPRFYPKTPEERMAAASVIAKKMDGKLVELFGKLPRMPYDIRPIPADIAEKTTTAYYSRPAGDGSRPGTYYLNLTKLDQRPLYELEALTLHEAVPGHHLQIALAQELDLPDFRRYGGFTAFTEGWGLYSERLGLETGFYGTPYTDFGRLSYEMWRATRLVVDTGLHAKGWTRREAIDYMADNTGLSLANIEAEVDRYITVPGQALAYKIGELKIRELRSRAEQALGENFDVRRFHDALLGAGAVPLDILELRMDAFIAEERKRGRG